MDGSKVAEGQFVWQDLDAEFTSKEQDAPSAPVFDKLVDRQYETYGTLDQPCPEAQELLDQWSEDVGEDALHHWQAAVARRQPVTKSRGDSSSKKSPEDDIDEVPLAASAADAVKINEAVILGEEHPDMTTLLDKDVTFMTGKLYGQKDRRNTKVWPESKQPWSVLLLHPKSPLTNHPVSKSKEGDSIVIGHIAGGERTADAVTQLDAIVIDIDSGPSIDDVTDKLLELGVFAVIHSSFNHMKSKLVLKHDMVVQKMKLETTPNREQVLEYLKEHHPKDHYDDEFLDGIEIQDFRFHGPSGLEIHCTTPPLHKMRIILPLMETAVMSDLGTTATQWKEAWADIVTGFVVNHLGVSFDSSSCDVNRLFYLPRHPKGAEYVSRLIQGRPVRYNEIETYSKKTYVDSRGGAPDPFLSGAPREYDQPPQVQTPAGLVLNAWHRKAKDRFLITELFQNECQDKVRRVVADGKVEIECPFEHFHTHHGGTGTVAMDPHINERDVWTVSCPHDACAGRHKFEFLGQMVEDGWFDEGLLKDGSPYLMPGDDPISNAIPDYDTKTVARLIEEAKIDKDTSEEALMTFLRTHIDADTAGRRRFEEALGNTARNAGATVYTPSEIKRFWKLLDEEADQPEKLDNNALCVDDGFDDLVTKTEARVRLENSTRPLVFNSHGSLAAMRRDANGQIKIKQLHYDGLSREIASVVKFQEFHKPSKSYISCAPPSDVVKHVFHGHVDEWALPLRGLEEAPFFDRNGNLVVDEGYHVESQVYLSLPSELDVPRVSARPSADEVTAAVNLLDDLVVDFPFDGQPGQSSASKTNFIGLLLQPFMRDMIDGPTPAFLVDKPAPGTGAGLLLDAASIIWTGSHATTMSVPKSKQELGQTIIAKLRSGASYLIFDNIPDNLDSDYLAMAISQGSIDARILGRNDGGAVEPVEVRATWVLDGNNVTMSKELARRAVLISLDSGVASPESRTGWKHPNLKQFVKENRERLIWACLTLIQNWIAKGRPSYSGEHVKGTFEEWLNCIGGVLQSAGYRYFYDNCSELHETVADSEDQGLERLAGIFADQDPGTKLYARDVREILLNNGDPILIHGWGYDDDGTYVNTQTIGKRFAQFAKKPHRGRRTVRDDKFSTIEIGFTKKYDAHEKCNFYVLKVRPIGHREWIEAVPSPDSKEWAAWQEMQKPDNT